MPAYRLRPERTVTEATGRRVCEVFGAADGHDDLSVAWIMLPSGCRGPEERNRFAEAVIVLSGQGSASIDGRTETVGAGHSIYVPAGSLWRLDNTGREPLVCYSICAPAFAADRSVTAGG